MVDILDPYKVVQQKFDMDLGVGDVHQDSAGGHYEPVDTPHLEELKRILDDAGGASTGGCGDEVDTAASPPATGQAISDRRDARKVTMPFVSEAQRRFLWVHHPDIARRWEKLSYDKGMAAEVGLRDAALVVVRHGSNGKVLTVTRGLDRPDDHALPGGHLEPGESPAMAAHRELLEETGVDAAHLEHLFSAPAQHDPATTVHVYRALVHQPGKMFDVRPSSEGHVRWSHPSDLVADSATYAPFAREHFEKLFTRPGDSPMNMTAAEFERLYLMAEISAAKRKDLGTDQFADPANRKYPIHDAAHTRNAAARLEQQKGSMSPAAYKAIRGRIASAAKKFGIASAYNKPKKVAAAGYSEHQPPKPPAARGGRLQVHADLQPGGRLHVIHHTMSDKRGTEWSALRVHEGGDVDASHAVKAYGVQLKTTPAGGDVAGKKLVWIQLAEVGHFRGHPAGVFSLTPTVFNEIVSNFEKEGLPIPVDYEHASEQDPTRGNIPVAGAPAQGWIHKLDNRGDDGLWGLVEWSPRASEQIKSGEYRYISPAIRFGTKDRHSGEDVGAKLTSAGLTNQPFLKGMRAIAAKDVVEGADVATVVEVLQRAPEGTELRSSDGIVLTLKHVQASEPEEGADMHDHHLVDSDAGDSVSMQTMAHDMAGFSEHHLAGYSDHVRARMRDKLMKFGSRKMAHKPSAYMPKIKAALHLHALATAAQTMGAFRQLRDRARKMEGATAIESDHTRDGVKLHDYLGPLRELAAGDRLSATLEEILEIVEHMICVAMERHELLDHMAHQIDEEDEEEHEMSSLMQDLAKDADLAAFSEEKQPPQGTNPPPGATPMTTISLTDHQNAIAAKEAEIKALKTKLDASELALSTERGKTAEMTVKLTGLEAFKAEQVALALDKEADGMIANPENYLKADKKPMVLRLLKDNPEVAREMYKPAKVADGPTLPPAFVHLRQTLPQSKPGPVPAAGGAPGPVLYEFPDGTQIDSRLLSETPEETAFRLMSEKQLGFDEASQEAWDIHRQITPYIKQKTG